jgi:hypothetical protein
MKRKKRNAGSKRRNEIANDKLGASGGGGGATWGGQAICGDPLSFYDPTGPYYIGDHLPSWVDTKYYEYQKRINAAAIWVGNTIPISNGTITLGDNMGCNAKEKKFTYRWEITVVDISKTKTDNREVLKKTVWVDSNVDNGKVLLKYSKAINDALSVYNTTNSAEVTLDDCYVQAKYVEALELKDSD